MSFEVAGVSYSADVFWLRLGYGCLSLSSLLVMDMLTLKTSTTRVRRGDGCLSGYRERAGAFEPWFSGGLDPLLARAVTPVYGLARGVPLAEP